MNCATLRWGAETKETVVGFIGYRHECIAGPDELVRIFLECREESSLAVPGAASASPERPGIECSYVVDVIFPRGNAPCRLRGVEGVLALKKFYKLVFSLEERAREHSNDWRLVMASSENLLKHLAYTRNARNFTGQREPRLVISASPAAKPERLATSESA